MPLQMFKVTFSGIVFSHDGRVPKQKASAEIDDADNKSNKLERGRKFHGNHAEKDSDKGGNDSGKRKERK